MKLQYIIRVFLLMLFVPFTSIRPLLRILRYSSDIVIVVPVLLLWGASIVFIFLHPIFFQKFKRYFDNMIFLCVLVLVMILARIYLYPVIEGGFGDGLSGSWLGSTGDDAFFLPINRLLNFLAPYDFMLVGNVPISPGLGWLLINLPFGFLYTFPFLVPFYLFLTVYLLKQYSKSWIFSNVICMCIVGTAMFWSLLCHGHDLPAVALSLIISFILVERGLNSDFPWYYSAIIVGFFSTSRVIFMLLPFLFLLIHFKFSMWYALKIFLLSLCTMLSLHTIGFIVSEWYQPMHLFNRGLRYVGIDIIFLGIILVLFIGWISWKNIRDNFHSRLLIYTSVIASILILISFGELRSHNYVFVDWEGLNYLYVASPIIIFAIFNGLYTCAKQKKSILTY